VVRAVIFDFYGTLARFADAEGAGYEAVLAAHGYTPERTVLDAYVSRYDGVEHAVHSVNEHAYESWVRARLRDLVVACGVADSSVEDLVDALRASDRRPMVSYPEAATTLTALRRAGLAIGVCSNWGWELDEFLDEVGLLSLVDVGVTSARAGSRKPHPGIYASSVEALGVQAADVVFVGDSWGPDVQGPRRLGMTAVHVWREEERRPASPPPLRPGDYRVGDLTGVLDILAAVGAGPRATSGGTAAGGREVAADGEVRDGPGAAARWRPGPPPTTPGRRR
jgi:putative hydrolase of the HAD superfamily